MEYTMLHCDQCGKEQKEREAIGWIRTSVAGVEIRACGDPPLTGEFCSRECCADFLLGKEGGDGSST